MAEIVMTPENKPYLDALIRLVTLGRDADAEDIVVNAIQELVSLRAELAEVRINVAAEIHQEGHRLMVHDRNATLHQLLTYIERRYGKDNLVASWNYE